MGIRIEFVSLELKDFVKFGGMQTFVFARPPAAGASALTVATGAGGSGKTCLITALRLALWGVGRLWLPDGKHVVGRWAPADAFAKPDLYFNAAALAGETPQAFVRLTLRVARPRGASTTLQVTRTLAVGDDGRVMEGLNVTTNAAGRTSHLVGAAAQRRVSRLLPPARLPLVFADCEMFEYLGVLAARDARRRLAARRYVQLLTGGGCPVEWWLEVAPTIIAFANRLLACGVDDDLRLLTDAEGREWPGAYEVCPGTWVSRDPDSPVALGCIGSAVALGLHLAGGARVPFVLDAPALRIPPEHAAIYFEALSGFAGSQVVITAHECQVDELAMHLWGRAHRIYLVEDRRDACTALLSEPVLW